MKKNKIKIKLSALALTTLMIGGLVFQSPANATTVSTNQVTTLNVTDYGFKVAVNEDSGISSMGYKAPQGLGMYVGDKSTETFEVGSKDFDYIDLYNELFEGTEHYSAERYKIAQEIGDVVKAVEDNNVNYTGMVASTNEDGTVSGYYYLINGKSQVGVIRDQHMRRLLFGLDGRLSMGYVKYSNGVAYFDTNGAMINYDF